MRDKWYSPNDVILSHLTIIPLSFILSTAPGVSTAPLQGILGSNGNGRFDYPSLRSFQPFFPQFRICFILCPCKMLHLFGSHCGDILLIENILLYNQKKKKNCPVFAFFGSWKRSNTKAETGRRTGRQMSDLCAVCLLPKNRSFRNGKFFFFLKRKKKMEDF